ncbi:hypothetical protein HHK36_021519 [Tetracentron sinense]|uniref:BED-type domain-containing protein n=1 Tax=Tetracentron sinense TaxID=13715 RepID=A0A834YV79_TETSI|nr:hypothetical protein HHK36_021519 [Tetracentron sinense]
MPRQKDPLWEYVTVVSSSKLRCNFCQEVFTGTITRLKYHLSKMSNRDVKPCPSVPDHVWEMAEKTMVEFEHSKKQKVFAGRSSQGSVSSTVSGAIGGEGANSIIGPYKQVRVLLDRAYAVSKTWNDAPVVICGDFNCTPKVDSFCYVFPTRVFSFNVIFSPLYNFISEQKLNLIGLDRDKVSGQSSAQIHAPKPYSSNPGQGVYRAQSADTPMRASELVDEKEVGDKQSNFLLDMHEHNKPHSNSEIAPLIDNLSLHQSITSMLDTSDKSFSDGQYGNESSTLSDAVTKETQQDVVDDCKDETSSSVHAPIDGLTGSRSNNHDESGFSADVGNDGIHEFTSPIDSRREDIYTAVFESVCGEKVSSYTPHSIYGSFSEHSQSEVNTINLVAATMQDGSVQDDADNESLDSDEGVPSFPGNDYYKKAILDEKPANAFISDISSSEMVSETLFPDGVEACPPTSLENCSSESIASEEKANPSTPYGSAYQAEISDGSTSIDLIVDQKLGHLSANKLDEVMEKDGSLNEDYRTFLSELCNTEDVFLNEVNCDSQLLRPDSAEANQSLEECATIPPYSQLHSPSAEVQDFSPLMDSDLADVEKNTYDPSLWTPMEIKTASGNVDCTLLEHPLKLRSTYVDVEFADDYSGTRDANREPRVTSYNRRFLGTVDYIWCSKGLQTVKVLNTIPKHVLQWTSGFPTKKWGSDHIALACELAFMKDVDQS